MLEFLDPKMREVYWVVHHVKKFSIKYNNLKFCIKVPFLGQHWTE